MCKMAVLGRGSMKDRKKVNITAHIIEYVRNCRLKFTRMLSLTIVLNHPPAPTTDI